MGKTLTSETIFNSFENAERIIGVSQRYPELSILYNASFGSNNVRLDVPPCTALTPPTG